MLTPMSLSGGMALPIVFSVGTGLPVMFFPFVIAYSIKELGINFKAIQKIELVIRKVAGITFLITDLYYINIYLKLI